MQKSKIILGASAAILAIASAFSTKNINRVTHPYHHTRANEQGQCKTYANLCTGGTNQVWTQGSTCKTGNQAYTNSGCSNILMTNKNL